MNEHLPAPLSLSRALLQVLMVVAGVAAGVWLLHKLASIIVALGVLGLTRRAPASIT
jgi:hypothetical protein